MRKLTDNPAVICLLVFALVDTAGAEVTVSGIFGDHMVVQRDMPLPVWGTSSPNEPVTVSLGDRKASASADASGHWRVRLDPLPAGGPFQMTVAGSNTVVLKDVLVGEVWICSGQSNMAFPVAKADNGEQEVAKADHPSIRLFLVPRVTADEPQAAVKGEWRLCTPETVAAFSAVGYFFGREIRNTLKVPVGLIDSSWGGTPAEAWTARRALAADPDLESLLKRSDLASTHSSPQVSRSTTRPAGTGAPAGRSAARNRPNARPASRPAPSPGSDPRRPAVLYNAMIHPLIPYAIRGTIWYQGEANTRRAYAYRKLLPTMIRNWRSDWGQGDFPFLIVQLANYHARQNVPYVSDWAELREAQLLTLSEPKTGLAVTIDIGNPKNIHPTNKQEVGRRLALAARAIAYGQEIPYSGPICESHAVEGDKIRLRFKHADGGLAARDGKQLIGFAVAGEDRKFVEATAAIEGDTVVVGSARISRPIAVRYAWADTPECNLVNGAGLPASPFRTDDWPLSTSQEK